MDANRMAAGIVLTSAGIPFMLSGGEFARTKYGNSDSYDSARELNWLDWLVPGACAVWWSITRN